MKCWRLQFCRSAFILLVMTGATWVPALPVAAENVAIVNGSFITDAELALSLALFNQQMAQQNRQVPESRLAQVREQILDNIINQELMYQESQKKKVAIDQDRIEMQIDAIKAKFPDAAAFKKAMSDMGISEQVLRKQMRKGYAIDQWIKQEFVTKIEVGEKEIRAYYDEHAELFAVPERIKASHILVKVDRNVDKTGREQARQKLAGIQAELQNGADFADLARKYSEGPSGPNGGDLGFFKRGQMVKPFEEAAFELKPGEVSGIVETQFGFHLIKVYDKTPAKPGPYEQKKEQVAEMLKRDKVGKAVKTRIAALRQSAEIEKF